MCHKVLNVQFYCFVNVCVQVLYSNTSPDSSIVVILIGSTKESNIYIYMIEY